MKKIHSWAHTVYSRDVSLSAVHLVTVRLNSVTWEVSKALSLAILRSHTNRMVLIHLTTFLSALMASLTSSRTIRSTLLCGT